MKVIVFGSSGKVGTKVVNGLLEKNHQVTAFVYGNNPFVESSNLKIIIGNVKNEAEVKEAVRGNEAVLSALGSWGTSSKDILSSGIINIINAMKEENISRIVSLTGTDAFLPDEKPNYLRNMSHTLLSLFAKKIMLDGEIHAEKLAESGLDWTIIRSPVMNNKEPQDYELNTKPCLPVETINRHAVAESMVEVLEQKLFVQESPFIHRK
jgi:putative NADH-flavin reductase